MTKLNIKRIGVLTSGGDAPGMNACIRGVVRSAGSQKIEVVGIKRGYAGLIDRDTIILGPMRVSHIMERGGTFLDSSRCPAMKTSAGLKKAVAALKAEKIDGLITIGGDGTFRGAAALAETGGIKVVGIPGTIDNDVYGTDYTIGFDTAINTALQSIDKVRDTAESLEMLFFVEVMGRSSGFIALAVGVASGAEEILIPETKTDINALVRRLQTRFKKGRRSALVIVAEGDIPGGAQAIAEKIRQKMKLDYRVVSLGHVQRGGSPTARDRILAGKLGVAAVNALRDGKQGCMVGEIGAEIVYTPLKDTWTKSKELDSFLLQMPHTLAI